MVYRKNRNYSFTPEIYIGIYKFFIFLCQIDNHFKFKYDTLETMLLNRLSCVITL